jgi:hypothetical protein
METPHHSEILSISDRLPDGAFGQIGFDFNVGVEVAADVK